MKRFLLLFASTAGIVCLAGTQARAGLIPAPTAQWMYNFTPAQSSLPGTSPAGGTGNILFTNEPTHGATGTSDVVLTQLKVSTAAPASSPDTISNGNYKFSMLLTDVASGQSKTLTFTGTLSGNFSQTNANVTNQFTAATQLQTVTLGNNVYKIFLDRYAPPGPGDSVNEGSISARVTVMTNGPGNPGGNQTPEPSSLVLSFLGVTFAGVASWRQRRRTLASLLA
jgi:hypothetical protein